MHRLLTVLPLLLISTALAAPRTADVKVTVRTSYESAEVSGLEATMMGVGPSRTTTVVLKGERLATMFTAFGNPLAEIIDFTEQKNYRVNHVARTYTETTFAEARREAANDYRLFAKSLAEALAEFDGAIPTDIGLPTQSRSRAKRFDFRVDVTEPGVRKRVAGQDTRQFIITITAWEKGKTLDDSGGWMAAAEVWLAPRVAAVDDLVAVERRYAAAIAAGTFDPVFTDIEMPKNVIFHSRFSEEAAVAARVLAETAKLDGTVLASGTTYGLVRNARDMKLLTSRHPDAPPAKIQTVTKMTLEYLSIDAVVTDADVSIPAGFKRKK